MNLNYINSKKCNFSNKWVKIFNLLLDNSIKYDISFLNRTNLAKNSVVTTEFILDALSEKQNIIDV